MQKMLCEFFVIFPVESGFELNCSVQHSIKIISRNINAVFLKLGTRNVNHKKKQNYSCHVIAMTTFMPLALF